MNMRPGVSTAQVHTHSMRSVLLGLQLLDDVIEDLVGHVLPCQGVRMTRCHSRIGKDSVRGTATLQGHVHEQEIAAVHEWGRSLLARPVCKPCR